MMSFESEWEMSTKHTLSGIRLVDKRTFGTSLFYDHIGALINHIHVNCICIATSWILTYLLIFLLFVDDSEVPLEFTPIFVRIYLWNIYNFLILTRINLTNYFWERASKIDVATVFWPDCNANDFVEVGVIIYFEHNYTWALVFRIHVILILLITLRCVIIFGSNVISIRNFINIHLLLSSRRNWNILRYTRFEVCYACIDV